jgi:hypothetical protein
VTFDRIEPVLGTVNLPGKVSDRIFPEHLVPEAGNRRRVVQLGLPELFLYKRFWFRPGCTLWSRLFFRIFIRVPACPSYSLILVMPGTSYGTGLMMAALRYPAGISGNAFVLPWGCIFTLMCHDYLIV